MKSLIAILSAALCLLCWGFDLSAQEKKDDKKWEISGYFGGGGAATEGGYGSTFAVPCFGLGLEYYLISRISVEGQISYLPNIASARPSYQDWPLDWSNVSLISLENKYRLLWDINLLFYFDIRESKKPPYIRLFLTVGTGYQYDREERIYVSLSTLQQFKYGYGSFWFQWISFGGGLKVNIKDDWALRLLYKIHRLGGESIETNRFALGLSYRF
ncbi:MAG: outer membrane beta-barrel protein [Acidobacteriota bacterium]